MSLNYKGKTCVITGAGGEIGQALALKYAEEGASLVLIDRNAKAIKEISQKVSLLGCSVLSLAIDLSSEKEIKTSLELIESNFGSIDILINAAGISIAKSLLELSSDEWDTVFNVNLKSVFLLCSGVARNMIEYNVTDGRIISISSQAAKIGEAGNGPYCASKAGVNTLTQVLALELGKHNITVNTVCPGFVDTKLLHQVLKDRSKVEGKTEQQFIDELKEQVPLKRFATPKDIVDYIMFLSSDKASYITGMSMTIAGGKTLV